VIVYNVSGSTAVEAIEKGQSFFMVDSVLLEDTERIRFHINGNRLFNLVSHTQTKLIESRPNSVRQLLFRGKSFLLVDHFIKAVPPSVKPDYLIISRRGMASIPNILNQHPGAKVILDGTCSIQAIRVLKSKLLVPDQVYAVAEQGAFVAEF